jgi:hypothetical protein
MSTKVFPAPLRIAHPLRYIKGIGTARVNAGFTQIRHPATADSEGISGDVDAPHFLRDRSVGRHSRPKDGVAEPVIGPAQLGRTRWLAYGPAGRRPHSRRAAAPYPPLRAGWALAPGHSGGSAG